MIRTSAFMKSGTPCPQVHRVSKSISSRWRVLISRLLEICYILRTYERHGRPNLNDPKSLRQSLICHRYDRPTERSVWIFVQPFQPCKDALWEEFTGAESWRFVRPHHLFLKIILPDWRWYFDHRRRFVHEFVGD